MKGKKKKELTMGLNDASGVIWAVFIIKNNGHHNSDPNNNDHNDNDANKWVQTMPDALFGPQVSFLRFFFFFFFFFFPFLLKFY